MTNLNTLKQDQLDDCGKQLISQVDDIIKAIESGEYEFEKSDDCEEPCASDYCRDILDINYVISADKEYLGSILLVAFGGPNIWINTKNKQVESYWGGDSYIQSYFEDKLGIDDYMEEIYNCS